LRKQDKDGSAKNIEFLDKNNLSREGGGLKLDLLII
jgi:hypothetical protein